LSRREDLYKDFIVARTIIETYVGPNNTFFTTYGRCGGNAALDPLRAFSGACREELRYESWSSDESPEGSPV
jgi:hypothetical protein